MPGGRGGECEIRPSPVGNENVWVARCNPVLMRLTSVNQGVLRILLCWLVALEVGECGC